MSEDIFDVQGRVVLVAGGARGLGESLARSLAERGARIVLADRLADEGEQVVSALPGEGHFFQPLDLGDESSIEAAVKAAATRLGRLDVVVNSAGVAAVGAALELSKEEFERSMAINVTGAFLLSRHAAKIMIEQGGGQIVHMASVSSRVSNPLYSAYSTSKAGLSQLVKILAVEWAQHSVNVNAIGPAMTPTPLTERQLLSSDEKRAKALAQIPIGRFGTPEDLLGTVLLLSSPAGKFITGQTIFVDGGRTLV
jgi:NAD(P)-dependent dehydrogenase (short-subunit alcohol dehydrogenase family)